MECLTSEEVAALDAGTATAEAARAAESHAVACPACRARLDVTLLRSGATPGDETAPPRAPLPSPGRSDAPAPGTRVGRYVVEGPLGAGGMGLVCAARDPELGRRVAIKVLLPGHGLGSFGSEGQARLLREAQAMARLDHPNVLPIFDVGTWEDRVYLVMDLVEGGTLADWLAERRRSWREVVRAFREAGRGLAAAHAAGIVHRDFKPANVLVGRDGRVRVCDFGIARASSNGAEPASGVESTAARDGGSAKRAGPLATPLTSVGVLVGTPAYMAPTSGTRR